MGLGAGRPARRELESLDGPSRDRRVDERDEIVDDEWRDPPDYLEPLEGAAHHKLRIGQFGLGCRIDRSGNVLYVLRIQKRGGDAYRGDD